MTNLLNKLRSLLASWLLDAYSAENLELRESLTNLLAEANESRLELEGFKYDFHLLKGQMDEVAAQLGDKQQLVSQVLKEECPTCSAPWIEHHCPYTPTAAMGERICDICHSPLPIDTRRTSEGKWRCRTHKSD